MIGDGYTDVPAGKIAAVVTHLEMRAPPERRLAPEVSGFTLDRVTNPKVDWYRDLFTRVGQDWLWFSRLRLTPAALQQIITHRDVAVFALRHGGVDAGLLELDFREPGQCELAFIGVTKPHIGCGAGRLLMTRALEEAWSRPISRFWVHSCTLDHPAALAFYLRAGFTAVRRQIEIADDPRLAGEIPTAAAPHVPLIAR